MYLYHYKLEMDRGEGMAEKNKKRNLILTAVSLIVILSVSAVLIILSLNMQRKAEANDIRLSADDVVTGITKKMNYTNLSAISNIERYYEIPKDTVSDYAMYISGKSGVETEIACFVLKDSDSQSVLDKAISEYLNEKNPSSQASAQLINSSVATHYPYVLVVVAQDSESAVKAFETVLNESRNSSDA